MKDEIKKMEIEFSSHYQNNISEICLATFKKSYDDYKKGKDLITLVYTDVSASEVEELKENLKSNYEFEVKKDETERTIKIIIKEFKSKKQLKFKEKIMSIFGKKFIL